MKTIVVLGTGLAAAPFIRQTMRSTVLPSEEYKLIVVSPNDHFHWPVAMPRAIIPGRFKTDQVLVPLEPIFKEYPADKFEYIKGKADSFDPESNFISLTLSSGQARSINYHTLVIATGSRAKEDMPWKNMEDAEKTKAKIQTLRDQIAAAKTIVVAGGGVTGVETAGEIGSEYRNSGKELYMIHNEDLPLYDPVIKSVRKQAKNELAKLNFTLIPNSQVVSSTATSNGETTLVIRNAKDGTTKNMTTQAYIPTFGLIPNSEFVPPRLLDSRGYIKQDKFLNAEGYTNIFVLGDVGNFESSKVMIAQNQAAHLIKHFPKYVAGEKMVEYKSTDMNFWGVTVGRDRAVGQMGNWKLFSALIWFMKGRTLGTQHVAGWSAGKEGMMMTFEKS